MKKINEVKKLFSKFEMDEYKKRFSHKQMRFVCSKIVLLFKDHVFANELEAIEKSLLEKELNKDLFKEAFTMIDKLVDNGADWASLGQYMWYAYQTSRFFKDIKRKDKNIYTKANSVKLNELRRQLYGKWMHSLNKEDVRFNEKIMAVAKLTM